MPRGCRSAAEVSALRRGNEWTTLIRPVGCWPILLVSKRIKLFL